MRRLFFFFSFLCSMHVVFANGDQSMGHSPNWFKRSVFRVQETWRQGDNESYLPVFAWHNRYTYSKEYLQRYNELPLGGGMGKSYYDEDGNWNGLYAMAFLDSHRNIEPTAGYAYCKSLYSRKKLNFGLGYTALLTMRADILHDIPLPGILPMVSLSYDKLSVTGAYVPGGKNIGNIFFLMTRFLL